ncbi:Hypothetical protein LDBND_1528 [Lactobacillus delbrueckii subsp. bulgaricus ND02]|nr:Hypothetical protein LDBND_1528 [Lactobacillus delbrueckii subsp. bulgaricus ND02]
MQKACLPPARLISPFFPLLFPSFYFSFFFKENAGSADLLINL